MLFEVFTTNSTYTSFSNAAHQLLEHGGKLCKRLKDGSLSEIIVELARPRVVINEFMSWVLEVIKMLGYNSWKFDDNFLLYHLRQKLERDLIILA